MDIAVVDYGMGNLRSVAKALAHVAPDRSIVVTADPAAIRDADRVVLLDWAFTGHAALGEDLACLIGAGALFC